MGVKVHHDAGPMPWGVRELCQLFRREPQQRDGENGSEQEGVVDKVLVRHASKGFRV